MPDLTIPWKEVEELRRKMEHHLATRGTSEIFRFDPQVSMIAIRVAADQFCREHGCVLEETKLGVPGPYIRFGAH